jgi:uncharacterized protein YcbK (DUF882 family)
VRRTLLAQTAVRVAARFGLAGALLLVANASLQNASAEGDTRTLTFHHLHTGEDITVTYMRDGRYNDAALKKLDWFMRDWRKSEDTHMDPHLFDILWQVYREVGATQPIDVVCGYRSPGTNSMLRKRSKNSGVAESSQHTRGKAMDFYIPGVQLAKLREIGFRLQRGGVGFYPSSGSPFVHMDTGTIRAWPRMTYAQLEKVFPNGRTVHISSDGRVLPHYAQALAEVARRGNMPNGRSLEAARAHGAITGEQIRTAELAAKSPQKRTLLATLFGIGRNADADVDADEAEDVTATMAPAKPARTKVAASVTPKPVQPERIAPPPAANPQAVAASKAAAPVEVPYVIASGGPDMLASRGLWLQAEKTPAKALPAETAPADVTSSTSQALAYAPADESARRPDRLPVAPIRTADADEVVLPLSASHGFKRMRSGAQRIDSPWIRAAMLTPSASENLTVTRFGAVDPRSLRELFYKPARALEMSFADDPQLGISTDRFTGRAVVFLATATFANAQTASVSAHTAALD